MNADNTSINIKQCSDCGLELKDKHLFCYNCGRQAEATANRISEEKEESNDNALCPNCDSKIKSKHKHCNNCGQNLKAVKRPFFDFVSDFLASVFHFDNKIWRTIKTLFKSPGIVIGEYNENKKARYVPPKRLYIFVSFIYFFIITANIKNTVHDLATNVSIDSNLQENLQVSLFHKTVMTPEVSKVMFNTPNITPHRIDSILGSYKIERDAINIYIIERMIKLKNGEINEVELANEYLKNVTKMVFVLMPVFAFIIFILIGYKKIYYSEAFNFSLYFHSFALILLMIYHFVSEIESSQYLQVVLITILFLYLLYAIKVAFKFGWVRSVIVTIVTSMLYLIIFASGFLSAILLSLI
jgi:DNA-directed RNA polymerase subunit RPC12/RpoP/positive regulator of sigma E activity